MDYPLREVIDRQSQFITFRGFLRIFIIFIPRRKVKCQTAQNAQHILHYCNFKQQVSILIPNLLIWEHQSHFRGPVGSDKCRKTKHSHTGGFYPFSLVWFSMYHQGVDNAHNMSCVSLCHYISHNTKNRDCILDTQHILRCVPTNHYRQTCCIHTCGKGSFHHPR